MPVLIQGGSEGFLSRKSGARHAKLHSAEHLKGARVSFRGGLQFRTAIMPSHGKLNLTAVLGKGPKSGKRLQDEYTLGQVLGESG